MRVSLPLCKQHIGRMFKRHWLVQGNRKIIDTGVESHLEKLGITVVDANKFVEPQYGEKLKLHVVGLKDLPIPRDEKHPDYKTKECHIFNETNSLVQGFKQAQILTKTVHMSDSLPQSVEDHIEDVSEEMHNAVKNLIFMGNVYDCEQKKLPKKKDPERPAYNFPRTLGITDVRRNVIMSNSLLDLLERNFGSLSDNRYTSEWVNFVTSFKKDDDLVQIRCPSNILLSSTEPLKPITTDIEMTEGIDLPDIHPMISTVSIPTSNFYDVENIYPLSKSMKAYHPHTTYLNFNKSEVKNLYELPVTDHQLQGRSLVHAFAVTSAYAKSIYGDIDILPKPVTLQCIHSDGRKYHFGVFQLNTLNVSGTEGIKNIWYSIPIVKMYLSCQYVEAIPELEAYNPDVIKYLRAFYLNQ